MVFIVILAGGGGERLWPKSRENLPKQFISLDGKQSLIQKTYEIANQIVDKERIVVSTRKELVKLVQKQLPQVNLLAEPIGRDSAAGMGYVCAKFLYEKKDEVIIFMGADYHITDIDRFKEVLETAIQYAEKGKISILGINPSRVETRFGYISPGTIINRTPVPVFEVKSFKEKPNETLAKEYIKRGYLWNSGMFIVKPSILYKKIELYMPNLYQALEEIQVKKFDEEKAYNAFVSLPKVSIDYGVMEKTTDLVVVKGDFPWDDIGTWDSLDRILKPDADGNVIRADYLGIDVENTVIFGEKPIIALGVSDIVVIDTKDCIFISHKKRAQDIKKIITELSNHPRFKFLFQEKNE